MVRELGPRFVRDGHKFVVHAWATKQSKVSKTNTDIYNGVERVFHETPGGKASGQFVVALKASIKAAFSDCDIVHYQCLNSAVFCWIPKLAGKCIVVNVDGQIWKDPKWPWGIRHLYFNLSTIISLLFASKVLTDSYHMSEYYKKVYKVRLPYIGYGCASTIVEKRFPSRLGNLENGFFMIMSRVTPHNLTDIMVDGFIKSRCKSTLVIAGHLPQTKWFSDLYERSKNNNVKFLGLVDDQFELNQLLLNCRAYIHGHSLGGINSALVRVAGFGKPIICIDTPFNREVVEYANRKLQAIVFQKNAESVADAIREFENNEIYYCGLAKDLGIKIRETMSWDVIYDNYRELYIHCLRKDKG